jgi:uroporphyrinogen decarboxylase
MMAGAEKLLYHVMKYKEEVMAGLEIVTDVMIDYIRALGKTGVHGIMFDTLFSSQCIMSRKLWMETERRFVPRMADAIREAGCMVMRHNCGTGPYMDLQIETMQPLAISIAELPDDCNSWPETKEKWGDKVVLCGAIEPARYAFLGTPDEMKEECKRWIDMMAGGG